MRKCACFFVAIATGVLSFASQAEVPGGVTVNKDSQIRLSPQIVRLLNVQTRSPDREKYIAQYIDALNSGNDAERIWGVIALGNFQADSAIKALIRQAQVEKSSIVIDQLFDELNGIFELFGFPPLEAATDVSASIRQARIQELVKAYEKFGYLSLFKRGWNMALKRGPVGVQHFVSQATARYDPRLTPFLLDILDSRDVSGARDQIETAVLCWSGYDLRFEKSLDVRKSLMTPDNLSNDRICERYRKYFERMGYHSASARDVALAVLFGETDKKAAYRREMALRMLFCSP